MSGDCVAVPVLFLLGTPHLMCDTLLKVRYNTDCGGWPALEKILLEPPVACDSATQAAVNFAIVG